MEIREMILIKFTFFMILSPFLDEFAMIDQVSLSISYTSSTFDASIIHKYIFLGIKAPLAATAVIAGSRQECSLPLFFHSHSA
jgi:hypothetical protein